MDKDSLLDELRRVELAVVEGERQLAQQEALLVRLKRQNRDFSQAQAELEMMRKNQQRRTRPPTPAVNVATLGAGPQHQRQPERDGRLPDRIEHRGLIEPERAVDREQ